MIGCDAFKHLNFLDSFNFKWNSLETDSDRNADASRLQAEHSSRNTASENVQQDEKKSTQ